MENRKDQIINLALSLIQQKGYVGFSYDDLAKHLGVSKASIHYHFEKKEDLGIAVCEKIQQLLHGLFESINKLTSVEEKYLEYISRRVSWLQQNEICAIASLQANFESLPVYLQERLRELSQSELNFLSSILAEAKNEGKIHNFEKLDDLAVTILCSLKGAFQYDRVLGSNFSAIVTNQLTRLLK